MGLFSDAERQAKLAGIANFAMDQRLPVVGWLGAMNALERGKGRLHGLFIAARSHGRRNRLALRYAPGLDS